MLNNPCLSLLDTSTFASRLIAWYHHHKRDLPWRHTQDPYLIWLSEVILQQTRVKQGLPYYLSFAGKFPTVSALAEATEAEVLRLWQGLGYYTRARNMQQTARIIATKHNGIFPNTYANLLALKGVGPYTAAAIASFAFREPVAVLDGNVYRVLSRLFGIETDIAAPAAKALFMTLANQLISREHPDLYNQAIMEFGALHCTPTSPDCLLCPFQQECEAYLTGRAAILPVKGKKAAVKNRFFHYMVLHSEGKIALKARTDKDIWQGLYDFMLLETDSPLTEDELNRHPHMQQLGIPAAMKLPTKTYTRLLSHQRIEARFWQLHFHTLPPLPESMRLYTPAEAQALPKPVLIANYLNEHFF